MIWFITLHTIDEMGFGIQLFLTFMLHIAGNGYLVRRKCLIEIFSVNNWIDIRRSNILYSELIGIVSSASLGDLLHHSCCPRMEIRCCFSRRIPLEWRQYDDSLCKLYFETAVHNTIVFYKLYKSGTFHRNGYVIILDKSSLVFDFV